MSSSYYRHFISYIFFKPVTRVTSSRYYSLSIKRLNRPAVNAVQWRHYSLTFALIHAKSKNGFQVANREISFGNVCMIQNCFIFFDRNSYLTFKLSTAQLWTGCTEFYNQTLSQSRNEISTHTEHLGCVRLGNPYLDFENLNPDFPIERTLSSKTHSIWFALIEKKLFGP